MARKNSNAMSQLHTQYLLSSRFSHALRGHLGIVINVVDDLLQGYQLTQADLKDAQAALKLSLRTIDSFRELALKPRGARIQLSLFDLFTQERIAEYARSQNIIIELRSNGVYRQRTLDPQLLAQALRCIFSYISAKIQHSAHPNKKEVIFELSKPLSLRQMKSKKDNFLKKALASLDDTSEVATLVFYLQSKSGIVISRTGTTLRDLVDLDQSIDSLGLLFAEEVLAVHSAFSLCQSEVIDGGMKVQFHLVFR